ncbi:BnaC03g55090D [Brassica napus]|uniref:BnaC03g55090D protein n=2 Tax=Brassica TaxID=3705 RepID=A0A078GZY2_BRANA
MHRDDKYCWGYTKSGIYTVKYGYWVARNIMYQPPEEVVSEPTWALASTPSCPGIFPISSVYTNLDYLFWRKSEIEDPNLDRDPYPWIIWYLWKERNGNLFRGISREPEELIRHAQSECNAWFDENQNESDDTDPPQHIGDIQGVRLENICLVDGSWTADSQYSGLGWVWLDGTGQEQLLGLRNK